MSTSFRGLQSATLLNYLPVLSSTATVFFALKAGMALFPLLQPSIPSSILSPYWKQYLSLSISAWVGLGAINVVAGYFGWKNNSGVIKTLYGWGTVFALAHNLFGPPNKQIVDEIIEGSVEESKSKLRSWLKILSIRTALVDFPAMVCFTMGFLHDRQVAV